MPAPLSKTAATAWARLMRAQQGSIAGVEETLRRAGFPALVWYDVLLELERPPGDGLRQRDIQRHTLLKRYNVSRIVERLETDGLIVRTPCEDDARGAVIRITKKGRELRRAMWPVYAAAIKESFARHYSEEEMATLAELLGPIAK